MELEGGTSDKACMAVPGSDDSLVHNGLLFVHWLTASHSCERCQIPNCARCQYQAGCTSAVIIPIASW